MSPQRPNSTKAAVSQLMQHCFWADDTVYIFKSPQRELEVRGQEELCKGSKIFETNQNVFNGIILRLISNCTIRFWQMVGAGFCNGAMTLAYHWYTFFWSFYPPLGRLPYYRDYPLQDGAGSALQSLTPEARSSADICAPQGGTGVMRREEEGGVVLSHRACVTFKNTLSNIW